MRASLATSSLLVLGFADLAVGLPLHAAMITRGLGFGQLENAAETSNNDLEPTNSASTAADAKGLGLGQLEGAAEATSSDLEASTSSASSAAGAGGLGLGQLESAAEATDSALEASTSSASSAAGAGGLGLGQLENAAEATDSALEASTSSAPGAVGAPGDSSAGSDAAGGDVVFANHSGQKLELLSAVKDQPSGAFLDLMKVLVAAVDLAYRSSSGPNFAEEMKNASIPKEASHGAVWDRVYELETDPQEGGMHARIVVSHDLQRVIVAFRGICVEDQFRQCQVDKCFLQSFEAFGSLSTTLYHTTADCKQFESEFNYVADADKVVRAAQSKFPEYRVLLTGHSLGGALAIVTAARQVGVLQAVTFAPTPFHALLQRDLGMSEAAIMELPSADLIATGDPYDIMINTMFVHLARKGATTCLYDKAPTPFPCTPQMKKDEAFDSANVLTTGLCKTQTHDWRRYMELVLATAPDGVTPVNVPSCSTDLSTFEANLFQALSVAFGQGHRA